jgi:hypothetical protein
VTITLWEGDCVRHTTDRFVGVHAGFTRLAALMERAGDVRAVRVQLPDGTIRVAAERSLEKVDAVEYGRYASSIGVALKGGKVPTLARRV